MISILAAFFLSLTSPVTPALHTPFMVEDNGGVLVTTHQLVPGQVITCGGIAYTVHQVRAAYGTYTFTVTPKLAKSGTCST